MAYMSATYRVLDEPYIDLTIGNLSKALGEFYIKHNCGSAAFITAYNPHGKMLTDMENINAQDLLESKLIFKSIPFIRGVSLDTNGWWPEERGILALGLSLKDARSIASEFKQDALVWVPKDFIPQLILLR